MIVLCVMNCPPGLRGDLSKWLNEVKTGVYVGKLNARVREELWNRVCSNIKSGQATMVYSTNNEQGYAFLVHNTTWIPVDYEGITLMRKPLSLNEEKEQVSFLESGFSKAAKYEKAKQIQKNKNKPDYVILNIQTTGMDVKQDRIIEIGMLRIAEGEVVQKYQCLVRSEENVSDDVVKLTGITKEMIEKDGIREEDAIEKLRDFIGNDLVVGYNINVAVDFLQHLGERTGRKFLIKKVREVEHLAKRKLDDLDDYRLETLAEYFSLNVSDMHRALAGCSLVYRIYLELNKL